MTRIRTLAKRIAPTAAALFAATPAWAHPGHGPHIHFAQGFVHPLSGLDHIMAMVAVGIFAARVGGRALWAVPLSFLSLMVVGGVLGMHGVDLPFVEPVIALSVVALGAALIFDRKWTMPAAMGMVGGFAIFHGLAHGTEMPAGNSVLPYALGFVCATALLHAVGMIAGLSVGRLRPGQAMRASRIGGTAITVVGAGILVGVA